MGKAIISLRVHSNLKSWVAFAGKGFTSSGELLRLIIAKSAFQQANDAGIGKVVKGFLRRERAESIGDTVVLAVRLPADIAELVKECANDRDKTTSEWCAGVLFEWYGRFHEAYTELDGKVDIATYSVNLRALVEELANVYAQKHGKQAVEA